MKKLLITLLSLVMVMSFSSIAFAEDVADPVMGSWDGTDYTAYNSDGTINTDTNAHGDSFDVTAAIAKGDGTKDDTAVYCVDIAWTMTPAALAGEGDTYIWDPSTLKYVKDETRLGSTLSQASTANDDAEVSITVTNKSNAKVKYAIKYESAKNSGTNISTATQTTTGKESGTLESAAKDVTPTLAGSPEDTVSTGTATSETYTAKVALAKNGEDYVASCSDTELVMGTYTVSIEKIATPPFTISFSYSGGALDDNHDSIYEWDGVNEPTALIEYECEEITNTGPLTVNTKYLIYFQDGQYGFNYMSGINPGTCAKLLKYDDLSSSEQAILLNLATYTQYIYNNRSGDLSTQKGHGDQYFVFELLGDGNIALTGNWEE